MITWKGFALSIAFAFTLFYGWAVAYDNCREYSTPTFKQWMIGTLKTIIGYGIIFIALITFSAVGRWFF